jgi:Mce-associated membrane protein
VDVAATAQVVRHVNAALEAVYSYDFARLDENERTARELITEDFSDDYQMLFDEVRQLAPDQPAVVSAVVANSAVKVLDGDRAIVVAFIDQQATRGVDAEQFAVPARLTVTAERVDDRWKIAAIKIV